MPLRRLEGARLWVGILVPMLAAACLGSLLTLLVVWREAVPAHPYLVLLAAMPAVAAAVVAVPGARALWREVRRRDGVEEELRASRAKFEGILSIAADAIITIDEGQRIVHFNHGAEALFGFREAEVLGQPLERFLPERFRGAHGRYVAEFASSAQVARRMGGRRPIFGLRRDGSEFPAEASISRLELPWTRLYTVVLRDISDRLRAEDAQRYLTRISGVLGASIEYETTLRSAVHLAIPRLADCCLLHVVTQDEQVRTIPSVHEDPDLTKCLRRLERGRADAAREPLPVADVLRHGQRVVARALAPGWTGAALGHDAGREALEALGVHAYVTLPLVARERMLGTLTLLATDPARRFDEGDLALADELSYRVAFAVENAWLYETAQHASRARDEMVGIVSHDLRNPLSAISMCARVLLENPPERAEARRDLAHAIVDATVLMQRLIQDLLDVSIIESGHLRVHPQPESLPRLVESALTMVREAADARGITLATDTPDDLPVVDVDALRVEQVLANLLANAVKFTERGGRVQVRAEAAGAWVRVHVSDTGAGIPAEHLPHIFSRYWHARRASRQVGTGLGLAIAQGIVEAHGGTIGVQSRTGVGSTFTFTIPACHAEGAHPS